MADVAPPPSPRNPPLAAAASCPTPTPIPIPNPAPPPFAPSPHPAPFSFRPLGAPSPPPLPYGAVPPPAYSMSHAMRPPGLIPPAALFALPPPPGGFVPQPGAAIPPPRMPWYPAPYPMICPGFPPRPMPPFGIIPLQRPPVVPGIHGVLAMVSPVARPAAPIVTPAEKPQTSVYVGKLAPTVDNDFLLSLLQFCGSVKSWKRAEDPSDGTPKGFGFCEFESSEGTLRAMRLLNKLGVDGQELVLNINQATREYLEKYVEKKTAQENAKETESDGKAGTGSVVENEKDSSNAVPEATDMTGDAGANYIEENTKKFGIVTDEDSKADKDAMEKISSMIEERLKTRPPPPPPVQPSADTSKTQSELSVQHNNEELDVDMMNSDAEDKDNDDTTSEKKVSNGNDKPEISSHDRRKGREKEKDRREREKEFERYEWEHERERVRREREKGNKLSETEWFYRDYLKEWESIEKEREYQRQYEKDHEKEKERERRRVIMRQEEESDDEYDGYTRKRRHRSSSELLERKRRRQREKEEDLSDQLKEEEIAEVKRRAAELQLRKEATTTAAAKPTMQIDVECSMHVDVEGISSVEEETKNQYKSIVTDTDNAIIHDSDVSACDGVHKNNGDETSMGLAVVSVVKQNSTTSAKKLGFGLIGSGRRTSVPSVFIEEDDEGVEGKRMRLLVPIDYSTEELEAVLDNSSAGTPNIVAAAEFAKCITVSNPKEDESEEKDRSKRSSDRSNKRDGYRNDDLARVGDGRWDKVHDWEKDRQDKSKSEKKIFDAKQLIDMIPRTKEGLFAYDVNWAIYDKHELHEIIRPWISKKVAEYLGEEEAILVDYIISCTKDHVQASRMLELLQAILDAEAEMFVLKMWRMLIFEIKKVEMAL